MCLITRAGQKKKWTSGQVDNICGYALVAIVFSRKEVGDRWRPEKKVGQKPGLSLSFSRSLVESKEDGQGSYLASSPPSQRGEPRSLLLDISFPLHPTTSGHSAEHHDRHREEEVAPPSLSHLGRRHHSSPLRLCGICPAPTTRRFGGQGPMPFCSSPHLSTITLAAAATDLSKALLRRGKCSPRLHPSTGDAQLSPQTHRVPAPAISQAKDSSLPPSFFFHPSRLQCKPKTKDPAEGECSLKSSPHRPCYESAEEEREKASAANILQLRALQQGNGSRLSEILSHLSPGRKVFALESKNNSQGLYLAEAEKACVDLSARLATAEELKRAVLDCSFAGCTTGWLASGSAGIIICRKTGSKLQSVKAIDVKIETDPFVNDQYDAFCIKDEDSAEKSQRLRQTDKPCGDPPSFPHTILHGHTGFEMGDELLYVCAQGYIMGNKETAFTLLCDSCGEWYGQVQACVKDETEAHIDYEDNFPDDRSMPIAENDHGNGKEEIEQEQIQLSFSKSSEEGRTGKTFSEPESEKKTDDSSKAEFSEGDNHIGVKIAYDEPGVKMFYDSEDFPIGPIFTTNDTKRAMDTVAITDESWLDGYPVTQEVVEVDEGGDKVDGSMGTENDSILTTGQPNHMEERKLGNGSPTPEEGLTEIVAATTGVDDEGAKETLVPLVSVSGLENFSVSRGYDDGTWEHLDTSLETVTQESTTTMLFDITSFKTSMSETSVTVSPSDHTPYIEPRDTTTYPQQVATTAPAPDILTDTASQELSEQENLTQGLGEKPVPTSEPCEGEDCPKPNKGAIIAVIKKHPIFHVKSAANR
ncbi:hypothetical protein IHE44_0000524 [Lamprotornis superbus]|uniref:Sushi domain-containing protein 5 n=1 Tax=Lamprotornis superbus TaxID=245042 RepID=A0A835NLS9_9PASS|nr:hypothetical protein IHE44_0000524 [Lamprotornis superbus]